MSIHYDHYSLPPLTHGLFVPATRALRALVQAVVLIYSTACCQVITALLSRDTSAPTLSLIQNESPRRNMPVPRCNRCRHEEP